MNPIVEFKNVSKTFYTKNGPFQALNQSRKEIFLALSV